MPDARSIGVASVSFATAHLHGTAELPGYLAATAAGIGLAAICFGIGSFVGVAGRGRARALGLALGCWVVFVFALDAIILAAVVAMSPPPPAEVGHGGHTEVAPRHRTPSARPHGQGHHAGGAGPAAHAHDHGHGAGGDALPEEGERLPWLAWLMLLDPVDLFRLSVLSASPSARARYLLGLPRQASAIWLPITIGWLVWLCVPYGLTLRRFGRLAIRPSR